MYKFSVIVPAYEASNKVIELVESLNKQTFKNFEVIFIDDCSRDFDELTTILKSSLHCNYRVMQLDKHINGAAARNKGIIEANGEYIAFADADDYWLEKKLEIINDYLIVNPQTNFLYHKMICKKENGNSFEYPDRGIRKSEDLLEYLFCGNGLIQTTSIICKKTIAINSLFDEQLQRHQDWDYCLNLSKKAIEFNYINTPLAVWNIRSSFGKNKRDFSSLSFLWFNKQQKYFNKKAKSCFIASVIAPRLIIEKKFIKLISILFQSFISTPLNTLNSLILYFKKSIKKWHI